MPVLSCDGERVGSVAHVVEDGSAFPPGLVIAVPRLFGIRKRLVTLTSFDVRDVRNGNVHLRISRWDANNRSRRLNL
jgi:hypothetical protein